jgi:hypothetical protein
MGRHIRKNDPTIHIRYDCPWGHTHEQIRRIRSVLRLRLARVSPLRAVMPLVTKVNQRPKSFIDDKNDVTAISPVAPGRTTFWHINFTAKRDDAIATIPALDPYVGDIDKHRITPPSGHRARYG